MKPRSKKFICIAIALLLITAKFLWLTTSTHSKDWRILINIRTNGIPYLIGIPLRPGALRNATFRVLAWSQLPVGVNFESDFRGISGSGSFTNMDKALKDLNNSKVKLRA